MLPVSVAASTTQSAPKVPPVIDTVALTSARLSGSDTERLGEIVVATDGATVSEEATLDRVGASLTAMTLTVSVCAVLRLNEAEPSLSTQLTMRVRLEPKLVGFSLVELNATVSSTLR